MARLNLWMFCRHAKLGGDVGVNPEHAGEIVYPIRPGNALNSHSRDWNVWLGRRTLGLSCLAAASVTQLQMRRRQLMDAL